MKKAVKYLSYCFTRCDSGERLNPLMHPFLIITASFAIAFLFFGDTAAVQATTLYQESAALSGSSISTWGAIGFAVILMHTVAFMVRGRIGQFLMQFVVAGGFFLWLWATIVYLSGGFWLQFLVACVPNLWFWVWYTWQWRRRVRGERTAFVH